jgi:hypothetical protein
LHAKDLFLITESHYVGKTPIFFRSTRVDQRVDQRVDDTLRDRLTVIERAVADLDRALRELQDRLTN